MVDNKATDKKETAPKAAPKKEAAKKTTSKKADAAKVTPAITLSTIGPAKGSKRPSLRKGRGRASGAGKTCNRGHNGEGQRSGRSKKRGFEGGQTPGYRRIPKIRTIHVSHPQNFLCINVGDLHRYVAEGETELTYAKLYERGFLKITMQGVRILGNGEAPKGLTVDAHYATAGAKEKLKKSGATLNLITEPVTKVLNAVLLKAEAK